MPEQIKACQVLLPWVFGREALLMSVDTAQLLLYSDRLCFVSCVCVLV